LKSELYQKFEELISQAI